MSDLNETSREGLHYPIYVIPPTKINITAEQFHKLSCFGIGALWCTWKYLFEKTETCYRVWAQDYNITQWFGHPRVKDCKMYEYQAVEMGRMDVPLDHPVAAWIEKHCQHLIIK